MKPYYQDEGVTIYQGDCRDILPNLDDVFFTFSDPPYNVNKNYDGWNDNISDGEYFDFCVTWIQQVKRLSPEICIYPPRKYYLQYWNMLGAEYKQIILPWSPEGAFRGGFINQHASLLTNAMPKERCKDVWLNVQTQGLGYFFKEDNFNHQGYTSEDLTGRVLRFLANPEISILDPFGGTGTTARIAKNIGRKCVTIEYSEKWCEFIAKQRLAQMVLV